MAKDNQKKISQLAGQAGDTYDTLKKQIEELWKLTKDDDKLVQAVLKVNNPLEGMKKDFKLLKASLQG